MERNMFLQNTEMQTEEFKGTKGSDKKIKVHTINRVEVWGNNIIPFQDK